MLPTRELVAQARTQLLELAAYARDAVSVVALAGDDAQRDAVAARDGRADVVCATPAAAREACERLLDGNHPLGDIGATCRCYVVDEADLVLGFGYDDDVKALAERLNAAAAGAAKPQGILLSATLGADVRGLKKLYLRRAATITLDEAAGVFGGTRDDEAQLAQYYVPVAAGDKDLVVYRGRRRNLFLGEGRRPPMNRGDAAAAAWIVR